jgi:hypothetical protein
MLIVRNYGNCAVWADVVAETETHWTFNGYFLDRETGLLSIRSFRQRKFMGERGRFDRDRLEDIVYQIGQSKAIRNAAIKALPEALKQICENAEKKKIEKRQKKQGANEDSKNIRSLSSKLNLPVSSLEARMGAAIEAWTPDDFSNAYAILRAIRDGETTIENEFGPPPDPENKTLNEVVGEHNKSSFDRLTSAWAKFGINLDDLQKYIGVEAEGWGETQISMLREVFSRVIKLSEAERKSYLSEIFKLEPGSLE